MPSHPFGGRWTDDAVEVPFTELSTTWQGYVVKLYVRTRALYPTEPVLVRVGHRPDGRWVYDVRVGREVTCLLTGAYPSQATLQATDD